MLATPCDSKMPHIERWKPPGFFYLVIDSVKARVIAVEDSQSALQ